MRKLRLILIGLFLVVMTARTALLFAGKLVKPETAVRALQIQGYQDITITDRSIFFMPGCGRGDAAQFTATATNPRGEKVELYVCVSWPITSAKIVTK